MRKFAKTLAVVGVLTPAGVNALGVGEIKLHSALNQKFLAEIPLLVSSGEDISQIKVRLASPAVFAKAGLDRPYYLANLRFKPIRKTDGSVVIQVTSHNAIREPFLDFLLEVNWPQGRMLKEFTVLLDPPVSFSDEVAVVQAVPSIAPEPVRHSRSVTNVESGTSGVAYGPVKRNESLWKIAERLKQDDSITTEQMVMALYRENPEAFLDGNVNNLKAGATLKIPSPQVISQLSPPQARRELREQYQAWLASKKETVPQESQKELVANVDKPKLKLEAPEKNQPDQGQVEMPIIEGPDAVSTQTQEKIDSLRAENEILKARLEALEQQMSSLLQLQNTQLAALQAKQQKEATELVPDSSTATATDVGSGKAGTTTAKQIPVQVEAEATPRPEQEKKPTPPQETRPGQRKTRPVAEKEIPPSFLSTLFDEPLFLGIGGGSLLLLGIAGWMVWRRRVESGVQADSLLAEMDGMEEGASMQASSNTSMTTAVTPTPGVEVAESSFLSEFTPSDFDILETENDAVDPIAEADVYLAYGRYQQAEELIKQALADEPEKPELRLKLLEIYYANEEGSQFEAYARELWETGAQQNEAFWHKVVEMGREICPESPLFVSAEGGAEQDMDLATSTPLTDVEMDSPVAGPVDLSGESAGQDNELSDLDFNQFDHSDAGEQDLLDTEVHREESIEAGQDDEGDHSLDFDLSDFDLELDGGEGDSHREGTQVAEESDSDEALEFTTFPQEVPEAAAGDEAAESISLKQADVSGEEFDLTDMDEIDTKLDLARAYVDMEDTDAARDILDEILERGNEQQRQEAQDLLDKLRLTS